MRVPVSAAAIAALSLVVAQGACIHPDCNAVCESIFDANAHVPGTAASLAGASVSFCRNSACASTTFGAPPVSGGPSVALTGAPFSARAEVVDEGDGFTVVEVSLDVAGLALTDGDTYSMNVADASGSPLLDATRTVTYDFVQSCGVACHDYTLDLYPTSASGIACGDKVCVSGANFTGSLTSSNTRDPITVSLCRNGACGTTSISLPVANSDGLAGNLSGALSAVVDIEVQSGSTYDFQIYARDDSAALSDGDSYTLSISQDATTLASWSGVAAYETTSPNGPQCDVFPCRFATIDRVAE